MSENNYAIEVFSGTSVTDADMAMVSGIIRVITGDPGYDGTPTYPKWEDDSDNTEIWYPGFLIPTSLRDPNRMVDLSVSGDYGTLSGFSFALRNNEKLWQLLDSNDVYLINRRIKVYAVIDDKFYQIWDGIISEMPYNETDFEFTCNDKSRVIHKNMPLRTLTPTEFPDVENDTNGDPAPLCIGRVPYALLRRVESVASWIPLSYSFDKFHNVCGATQLARSTTGTYLRLYHGNMPSDYLFEENELRGKFLFIVQADTSEGGAFNPEHGIRILSNAISSVSNRTTLVYLEESLDVDDGTFNTYYAYDPTSDESDGSEWYFRVATMASKNVVSEGPIHEFKERTDGRNHLDTYDENTKALEDVNQLVEDVNVNDADGYATMDIKNAIQAINNEVNTLDYFPLVDRLTLSYPDWIPYSLNNLTDRDRKTSGYTYGATSQGSLLRTSIIVTLTDDELKKDYSRLYLCPDIFAACESGDKFLIKITYRSIDPHGKVIAGSDVDRYYPGDGDYDLEGDGQFLTADAPSGQNYCLVTDNSYFFEGQWVIIEDDDNPEIIQVAGIQGGSRVDFKTNLSGTYTTAKNAILYEPESINLLPDEYYANGGDTNNEESVFDKVYGSTQYKDLVEIPSEMLDRINDGLSAPSIEVTVAVVPENNSWGIIALKELGIVGERIIDLTSQKLVTKCSGVEIGGSETDSVYNAFRYMLETIDGISPSDIDYDNISDVRDDWFVGRQVIERQSTLEYIKELCKASFCAIYPTRDGKRKITAWRDRTETPTSLSDTTNILRDSLEWGRTGLDTVFNDFFIKYQWNHASERFERAFMITKTDESAFPAFGSNWKEYFGGLSNTSYADGKTLWEACKAAFDKVINVVKFPMDLSELMWFNDTTTYDSSDITGTGGGSSAYKFLKNAVEWNTREKDVATLRLPLNATFITLELCDRVYISDTVFTNGTNREGWIQKISYDLRNDQIEIEAILIPVDGLYSIGDYIETGSAPNQIIESGSQPDQIIET